ncbi:MAG: hypothetical protein RBT42_00025 [Aquabacterium sp.]|jgi:hypothetical protein|uniref:hypothetical protein n=1 Tax=Aquabacterium sp. TaxID=1872578 RepID=UPI002A36554B|nr:hypothetical protein [Aquabacterium sp.]MDX9842120.1 hypothetical protein [Aquabacterium sp.]
MISYAQPKFWQRPWVMALALGALGLIVTAWWTADGDTAPQASAPGTPNSVVRGDIGVPASAPLVSAPMPNDGTRPPDFSAQEWTTLLSATADAPHPQRELARLVSYLRFQKGFAQWQALQNSPDIAGRHRLAEQLLSQLPERVRQGEMGAGEVTLLQQALLVDLVPDEAERQQRLALVQADLAQAMPPADTAQQAQDEARRNEYKRREAAIVADFQSRPEAQRNPAQLEAALEEARRAVYAPAN